MLPTMSTPVLLFTLTIASFPIYSIIRALLSPLRSIPGPLLARFSRIYYFYHVSTGSFHHTNLALHQRYGPIVRLAPNLYSIDSPLAVRPIYSVTSNYAKSDWYDGWRHPDLTKNSIFPQRDVRKHAELRKVFQGLYTLSSIVAYEGYVDECINLLVQRLQEFAQAEKPLNLGHWFQCYAFDVIADITYGERFGFLDGGQDIGDVFKSLWSSMWYSSLVGIYPEWHPRLYSWTENIKGTGAAARTYILTIIGKMVQKRRMANENEKPETAVDAKARGGTTEDFLSKIINAQRQNPDKVTDFHVFMMGVANVFAGSDTTAASLSATVYYLLRHPETLEKLREEIVKCLKTSGNDRISFKESLDMPYLQAVLKEAMRLHAATGLPLWRVVPGRGAQICGVSFPRGSVVGVNTWVAHYNQDVFGKDAAEFRPERWLEAEAAGGEKVKGMEAYYFPFGLGSRTCLGKHISMLEMSKLIPQLMMDFDLEMQTDWKTENFWFVKPLDFLVKIKTRHGR